MVGVPVLFCACECACWPLTCVMGVVVGVSGWWVFQWWVAVVCASRRVPGVVVCVSWLVSGACLGVAGLVFGVGGLVWACFGVGWLVSGVSGVCAGVVWLVLVGVCWLVCVVWFRMLTCLASFFLLVLSFVLSLVWLITGCLVVWGRVGVCLWGVWVGVGVFLWRAVGLVGGWLCLPLCVGGWVCFVDG